MKKLSYIVALLFVLAIAAQTVAMAVTPADNANAGKMTVTEKAKQIRAERAKARAERMKTRTETAKVGKGPAKVATAPALEPVQVVKVSVRDGALTLSQATVKPGKVRFEVRNSGKAVHGFMVKGKSFEQKTADIDMGKKRQMTVVLKPGRYDVYSPVGTDRTKGVKAILIVR